MVFIQDVQAPDKTSISSADIEKEGEREKGGGRTPAGKGKRSFPLSLPVFPEVNQMGMLLLVLIPVGRRSARSSIDGVAAVGEILGVVKALTVADGGRRSNREPGVKWGHE